MNLPEFYDLLEAHDWTYSYSDDHSAWKKGEASRREIEMILLHTGVTYMLLYDKYRRHIFDKEPKPERPTTSGE